MRAVIRSYVLAVLLTLASMGDSLLAFTCVTDGLLCVVLSYRIVNSFVCCINIQHTHVHTAWHGVQGKRRRRDALIVRNRKILFHLWRQYHVKTHEQHVPRYLCTAEWRTRSFRSIHLHCVRMYFGHTRATPHQATRKCGYTYFLFFFFHLSFVCTRRQATLRCAFRYCVAHSVERSRHHLIEYYFSFIRLSIAHCLKQSNAAEMFRTYLSHIIRETFGWWRAAAARDMILFFHVQTFIYDNIILNQRVYCERNVVRKTDEEAESLASCAFSGFRIETNLSAKIWISRFIADVVIIGWCLCFWAPTHLANFNVEETIT